MTQRELSEYFGKVVADRVFQELAPGELSKVVVEDIAEYLEIRAESAHLKYTTAQHNPELFSDCERAQFEEAWRQAEDLAYIVQVAENVALNTQRKLKV
jgi:hypothetical protein